MIITSNDPKHRNLGRDIELMTQAMSLLSNTKLQQMTTLNRVADVLSQLADRYDSGEKDPETLEHLTELKFIMNSCLETIERADREFQYYQQKYNEFDSELTKLVKTKNTLK